VYSGQNFTANGTLSYTYTWTPSSQSPVVTAAGAYSAEVGVFNSSWGTDYYWNSNLATINIANGTAPQTITFTPITGTQYALTHLTLSATASSGLPVSFSSTTPTICSVSGSTLSLLIEGTCIVHASQAGNSNYLPAPNVAQSFAVRLAPQTITFTPITGAQIATTKLGLSATASSGLAVSFTSGTTSVCTVLGSMLSLLIEGTCTVHAAQAGNSDYSAAPTVTQSFAVHLAPQTITFPAITGTEYALGQVTLTATASSSLPVTYTSLTTAVCSVSGATASLLIQGTCILRASQAGNNAYSAAPMVVADFAVHFVSQTITFPAITGTHYALGQVTLTATASSELPVSFTSTTPTICTVSGATASLLIEGTCILHAAQAGNSDYSAAPTAAQSFAVHLVSQTITFPAITGTQYAGTQVTLAATATSGLAVSYSSTTTTVCTVSGSTLSLLAKGTCVLHAAQAGSDIYAAAPAAAQSFAVKAAS
jgi:ribosomal protein S11